MVDVQLLTELYKKHIYKDFQSVKSDRKLIIEDYFNQTGVLLTENVLHGRFKKLDKDKLWEEINTKSFNERTDEFVDEHKKLLTPDDLLVLMGLDPDKFELSKHNTLNRWWSDIPSEVIKRIRNGQIKIGFQEKKEELTTKSIQEAVDSLDMKPIVIERGNFKTRGLLELAFSDMHIPNTTYDEYKKHQDESIVWIESQKWEEIIILVGGDLFHTNNSDGTTVHGTKVAHNVSLSDMYQQALNFYQPILISALENSQKVKAMYIEGNHDKDTTIGFAFMLSKLFPQVEFDIDETPFKYHMYHNVFIGFLHGDKPRGLKEVSKLFFQLFKEQIARADTVELHSQHLHHEISKDDMGFMIRTLTTANKNDKWTLDNGFVGARKTFQGFIFNDSKLKAILYIDGE